ncbi:MAG: AAA family ATPase [Patescibacteria group bacterium]
MYLEKLEIQGFKSFAHKNKLVFPGIISGTKRGITAIVGPNGSGKSNVADAVRWVLGEQSLKTLRGKKSEDVIFSGSHQKHQLSFAEVSLYLNNSDKSFSFKVDNDNQNGQESNDSYINYSEIIITRRLYRNGDSEYLINNSRVRLLDIQMLLAKANFGQKTYSVIGQGMVENFLNTSAAERKDFFDEATGVKQFQIKRDYSLNKLENSYENLQQTDMLLNEIQPRLKSLTRQVEKLKKRDELEKELREKQLDYYSFFWKEINTKLEKINSDSLELEKTERGQKEKIEKLLADLNKIKNTSQHQETEGLRLDLEKLQGNKNQYIKQLARLQAEIELNLEAQGQFDLSWLNKKQAELILEIERADKELKLIQNAGPQENKELEAEYQKIQKDLSHLNQTLAERQRNSRDQAKNSQPSPGNELIKELLVELEEIRKENDLEKIRELIEKLRQSYISRLEKLENSEASDVLKEIQTIQAEIISISERKQELSEQISRYRWENDRQAERMTAAKKIKQQLEQDLLDIESKIKKSQQKVSVPQIQKEQKELEEKIKGINQEIENLEDQLRKIAAGQENEKKQLFELQKNLQNLQSDHSRIQLELNDLKINATRQETRLEDLENNIRNESLDLLAIKKHERNSIEFEADKAQKRINDLKNQLEQIGGIDPESEKEYEETRNRFEFLNTQTQDLKQAIDSLEKIIGELDVNIKNRFDKEFKIIEEKFNEYFKILFNGGNAKITKLSLSEQEKEENGGSEGGVEKTNEELKRVKLLKKYNATGLAGIEIQATPPGKKIQSVSMLSGGERALTAIALICAIISANPSPFVVLDEVDAALDESNSERLAKILDDLSNRTQFIVITHNRASMKKANILYGLTMNEGVSQLLSLKLDTEK